MAEQKFEEAFQKLESIVKKLEDGNLSLEESLKAFEEGYGCPGFVPKNWMKPRRRWRSS